MDYFNVDFQEIPSIAPDLMFAEEAPMNAQVAAPVVTPVEYTVPVVLKKHDRESLLQFVLDDHSYARPYPILPSGNNKCMTPHTVLKLHPKDFPPKKKYRRRLVKQKTNTVNSDDDNEIDVMTVDKPDDLLVR